MSHVLYMFMFLYSYEHIAIHMIFIFISALEMKAAGLLFVCCLIRLVQYVFMEEKCPMTKEKRGYDFVVGKFTERNYFSE